MAIVVLLAMAGSSSGPGVAGADEATTLRIGTTEDIASLNPHLAVSDASAAAVNLQYDPLVGFGPELEYAPTGFAEGWARDGATWTFTIRDGMRWSDGRPADAGDVAFTFEYLLASMDPEYVGPWAPRGNDLPQGGASRADGVADARLSLYGEVLTDAIGLTTVELIDEGTVALTAAGPGTLLLGAAIPILPEHVWSSVTFEGAVSDLQVEPPVVGTGPYQAVAWDRGRSTTFARNRLYRGELPYVEEVRFQAYPDDGALADALTRDEIDYARSVAPERFDGLDADPSIVGIEGLGSGFTHVAFNTYADPIDGGGASTPAVRDARFRDALGYAVDQVALIEEAVDGHGRPGSTLVPPAIARFHGEPARPRRYDPAEARRRLADAGYRDSDGDGIREDAAGEPIDLRLFYPTHAPMYGAAARVVERGWEEVGVAVTVTGLEPDTLTERLYTPEAGGTAEYDVELWGWDAASPDPDFLLSLLTTSEIGGWSDSNYSNAEYDRLFERQRRAVTPEARRSIVERMIDLAYDEAPYHVLFYPDELDAYRTDRFDGWTSRPRARGVPLSTYGVDGYLGLVAAGGAATPAPPAAASAQPTEAAGPADPTGPSLPVDPSIPMLVGSLAAIAVATVLLIAHHARRRRT